MTNAMHQPMNEEELRYRIMNQLKLDKPDKMLEIFECARLDREAKARGETYVYSPPEICLILGGPYTRQSVQELVNERHEIGCPTLLEKLYPRSVIEDTPTTPEIVTPEVADTTFFDEAKGDWVEGKEVTVVILRSGSVSSWWEFLNTRLQNPTGWPHTMKYYVQRVGTAKRDGEAKMEVFRARKRFEHDENEIFNPFPSEAEAVRMMEEWKRSLEGLST